MKRLISAFCALALALPGSVAITAAVAVPAHAQSNDDDYTPLNSRIRRERQFPTGLTNRYLGEAGSATRERNEMMQDQLSRCLYDRSSEQAHDFPTQTDFGLYSFQQIDLENDRAVRIFGFRNCLRRVGRSHNSGVGVAFSAAGLRHMLLTQAYLDAYPEGPDWVQPGYLIGERNFPLSENNPAVQAVMSLADCLVANDPYSADFFFRSVEDSDEEARALEAIIPAISPCIPEGEQLELTKSSIRVWVGEGLWHASRNTYPAPAEDDE